MNAIALAFIVFGLPTAVFVGLKLLERLISPPNQD